MKQEWSKWQQSQNLAISLSPTFDPTPTQQNVQHSFNIPKTCLTVKPRHLCKTNFMNYSPIFLKLPKELLVGCGLTSHSAIFQLYSDGTVVQFSNLDLLPGTQCHGQLGVLSVLSLPNMGTRTSEDVFNLLAIRRPTHGKDKPGIELGSSDP